MGAETDLHRLVDLALRSPDAGVVNFNHLHSLLHAILNHIGLSYDPQNGVLNTQSAAAPDEGNDKGTSFEQLNGPGKEISDADNSNRDDNRLVQTTIQLDQRGHFDSLQMRQQNLENKVQELEDKLKILDNLPSTQFIIEQAQKNSTSVTQDDGSNQNVLSGMWQLMKFNSRLQATEEGIDRIMTILNEFLGGDGKGISRVKDEVKDIASELKNLKERFLGQKPFEDDNLGQSLSARKSHDAENSQLLQQRMHSLEKQLQDKFVTKDDLSVYVKWPALQEALNVKKSDFERKSKEEDGVLGKEQGFMLGNGQSSVLEKTFDHLESENKASDTESDGRPQSAPVPSTQQTPVQTPEVPKTAFTRSTQVNIQEMPSLDHPSQEMVECLRQIGELSEKHSVIEKKITNVMEAQEEMAGELAKVEETLPQKISKEDLNIPEDLQDQLALLKQGLEFLNTNQDLVALAEIKKMAQDNKEHVEALKRELAILARQSKQQTAFTGVVSQSPVVDSSVLDALREHLNELQNQQEKLAVATSRQHSEVVGDLSRKQEHIEALYNYVEKLQESKADKENVAMEMDIKADKASLDSKVNISTFDNTFSMLDEGLREALQKMDDYMNEEMALKQALKQLSVDMSEKMDGQAFQALKNYLERRIADVQKSRNMIAAEAKVDFSDAAGFRRPIKFNCISCSRPVELPLRGPLRANLPAPRGVRTKRSKGPYLSYEMDQIRQYQRGHYSGGKAERTLNDIISGRPCGGSHTVMYLPKRRTRPTQLNQVLGGHDDNPDIPIWGREKSVIDVLKGSDGHVYKGRFKQTIPPIGKNSTSPLHEHEVTSLNKEDSQVTSSHSNSGPNSPRNIVMGEPAEKPPKEQQGSPRETQLGNQSRSTSPRTRMRHIVKRHSSGSPPAPVPSPSPPTVRETEAQKASQKQERQGEDAQSKLFTPAVPRPSPDGARENDDGDPGGTRNVTEPQMLPPRPEHEGGFTTSNE